MDKYIKIILTIIAICLIALNVRVWTPERSLADWNKNDREFIDAVTDIVEKACFIHSTGGTFICRAQYAY